MLAPKAAKNAAVNSSIGNPLIGTAPVLRDFDISSVFQDGFVVPAKWFRHAICR
jgi:hypothetical protein